ncbi:hypothetical protein J2X68_007246 [Streptomyces sp. 3330]|nr:hypothetical protein [Streptomyces sp. 3330]
MTLRIDIAGLPSERLRFAASPLAELTAMLHVPAEPGHHPQPAAWAGDVWTGLRPELAERLREAEFLWRSSQADFLFTAWARNSAQAPVARERRGPSGFLEPRTWTVRGQKATSTQSPPSPSLYVDLRQV